MRDRAVRIRALAVTVALAVSAQLVGAAPGNAAPSGAPCFGEKCAGPPVRTVDNGYSYVYDAAGRFFLGVPRFGVKGAPDTQYAVETRIDCGLVAAPGAGGPPAGLDCVRAVCRVGARAGRWIIVFYRETAPEAVPDWTRGDRRCAVTTPPIPLRAVEDAASEHLRKTVDPAVPVVQPAAVTLVNFPTIMSTKDPGPLAFAIDQPLPGVVAVSPTYGWRFTEPDGTVSTATGAGIPYDGTLPDTPGYYRTHPFTAAGTAGVTVTATWTGTVTVAGVGPVALDPLPFTRTTPLTVKENRPVLTGN